MAAFGIVAICPSTDTTSDIHTFGYATSRANSTTPVVQIWAAASDATRLWYVTGTGDVIPGPGTAAALATTATAGFIWTRSCNGVPTGAPAAAGTGRVPLVYDYANHKLYAYHGSWRGVTLS